MIHHCLVPSLRPKSQKVDIVRPLASGPVVVRTGGRFVRSTGTTDGHSLGRQSAVHSYEPSCKREGRVGEKRKDCGAIEGRDDGRRSQNQL